MSNEKRYTVTLTERQLQVLSNMSEIVSRAGMGQVEDVLECLPLKPASEMDFEQWHEDVRLITSILSKHTVEPVSNGRFLGIQNEKVPESARIAWDMYQVFRHRLGWDRAVEHGLIESIHSPRNWSQMMTVNYDDPMQSSKEPLPDVERINI